MIKRKKIMIVCCLPIALMFLFVLGKELYPMTKNKDIEIAIGKWGRPYHLPRFEFKGENYVATGVFTTQSPGKMIGRNVERFGRTPFQVLDFLNIAHNEREIYALKGKGKEFLAVGSYVFMTGWMCLLYVNEKVETLPLSFYGNFLNEQKLEQEMLFQKKKYIFVGELPENKEVKKLLEDQPIDAKEQIFAVRFVDKKQWFVKKRGTHFEVYCTPEETLKEVPVKLYTLLFYSDHWLTLAEEEGD